MKGVPIENNGETLFSSDLLTSALGAKQKWDNTKQQGHPYAKQFNIYFKSENKNQNITVKVVNLHVVDLKKKVTWIDEAGNKRTNTICDLYKLFAATSNSYTATFIS